MNARFADTFFFLALLFEDDEAHIRTKAAAAELAGPIYTRA